MSAVTPIRQVMLEELAHGVASTQRLIQLIKANDWEFQPKANMRTAAELVYHLVSIPATDLAILQEKSEAEVSQIEDEIKGIKDAAQLCAIMQKNYEQLESYMISLSDDDFLNKATKAFYSDHAALQVKWLMEITTHTYHHRAQLYNYLKELEYDINFFILY
ncbi:DinB family protein [Paenibacillus spongiae]|uniref:DinB family protein n=1 Tax=Paenibacillus spongiae TaxID=2909671 RepID=A0ABY5S6D9_9BACL|nr:DinB family protein [Paenibacillus spongiae]UVI29476.1 DinB family protein [Paenibacillus spongiae]